MKTFNIRQFIFVGLLSMIILPRLFYVITSFVLQPMLDHRSQTQEAMADKFVQEITNNTDKWHDLHWQNTLRNKFQSSAIAASVAEPSGKKLFQIGHFQPKQPNSRQVTVVENGKVLGVITLFIFNQNQFFGMFSSMLAIALAFLLIGWQMGQYVLKPLAAMSLAARRIAKGDLDFELPTSRVTEVADVRAAFQAMGDGLRESLARQAKLEEERRFFITSIAHDLRTPLFALRGYLLRLEQGLVDSPEKMARYVSVCRQKSEQLERLISDLFAYSKTEYMEQTAATYRESVEFGPWIKKIVDHFRLLAQAQDVEIIFQEPEKPCLIQGDPHLLERAVENLLENALRHTPPKGKITVKWCIEGQRAVFTITDTGPGIPTQDLPHVFEPFYRAEKSRNPETGGTGLGLTIAKRILNTHGGDLAATNHVLQGAEFIGWLPISDSAQEG
ncbi:sensor histidine kinase [Laceyella putida]|uniref:histidine kinase n=1 Tax=Laceyella putida TaxID=110101 RepID=A0ABW2RM46_9BACL